MGRKTNKILLGNISSLLMNPGSKVEIPRDHLFSLNTMLVSVEYL
jgi:hypothetical protein